jgi:hypothetical protein
MTRQNRVRSESPKMVEDPSQRLVRRVLDGYERGIYTFLEVCHQILESVDVANAHCVLGNLPQKFLSWLRSEADSAPRSEDEWDKLKLFHIGSALYSPGSEPAPMTDEEQRHHDEVNKIAYRKKIEMIRDYFAHVDKETAP